MSDLKTVPETNDQVSNASIDASAPAAFDPDSKYSDKYGEPITLQQWYAIDNVKDWEIASNDKKGGKLFLMYSRKDDAVGAKKHFGGITAKLSAKLDAIAVNPELKRGFSKASMRVLPWITEPGTFSLSLSNSVLSGSADEDDEDL